MMDRLTESNAYISRAAHTIPGASQTLSKGPTQWTQLPVIVKGDGCHVWDMDGNEYIDLPGALGPVILGYNYPAVNEAIKAQLDTGIIVSSTPNPLEGEVAEMLCDLIPCAEMVRFGKNGSDVTSAAVRLARAVTGKTQVAYGGYHGWQDWSMSHRNPWDKGIPADIQDLTLSFKFNDLAHLESIFGSAEHGEWYMTPGLAAVILEPITAEEPAPGYLQAVRDLCTKHGTVLIFDEVKTGFRVALGGAQELYGVTPDLACFGKAMANGMPISALVGKRDLMDNFDRVFFSTTFGGECLSLAAAKATIGELRASPILETVQKWGCLLKWEVNHLNLHYYNRLAGLECTGHGAKAVMQVKDLAQKTLLQQEMINRGVLWNGEHMLNAAFTQADFDKTWEAYVGAFDVLDPAIIDSTVEQFIDGRHLTEVFRR